MEVTYFYDVELPNDFSATIQILRTGRAFADGGDRFNLEAARLGSMSDILDPIGLTPHPLLSIKQSFPSWPRHQSFRRLLARYIINKNRIGIDSDVIVSRGETALTIAPIAVKRKQPFVLEVHRLIARGHAETYLGRSIDFNEPLPTRFHEMERQERRMFLQASGIVYLTEDLRRATEKVYNPSAESIVIPSGVGILELPTTSEKTVDVVYVGKVEHRKGVDIAIRSMSYLKGKRLMIIGSGSDIELSKQETRRLGVEEQVIFTGRVPHKDVRTALARARVGICPLPQGVDSVSDAFTSPLKLLEMMEAGIPIVATDIPPVREICRNNVEAILVRPNDPEALATAVKRLLDDRVLSARLAKSARERSREFSWEKRSKAFSSFLNSVCALKNGASPT